MIYRFAPLSAEEEKTFSNRIKGLVDFGNYNKLPSPYRVISRNAFIQTRYSKGILYMEHRQIYFEDHKDLKAAFPDRTGSYFTEVLWYSGGGLAVVYPKKWRCGKDGEDDIVYDEDFVYLRLGCNHSYRRLSREEYSKRGILYTSTWHLEKCTKCGHVIEYDTSD